MNTLSKQTPLPTQSTPFTDNHSTNVTRNDSSLPTFVSHDLQTEFRVQRHLQQPQVRILHSLFKFHYHSLYIDCSYISILK